MLDNGIFISLVSTNAFLRSPRFSIVQPGQKRNCMYEPDRGGNINDAEVKDMMRSVQRARRKSMRSRPKYPLKALFPNRKIGAKTTGQGIYKIGGFGFSSDPRDWTWLDWAFVLGYITLWLAVMAGFILLVIRGNQCCS